MFHISKIQNFPSFPSEKIWYQPNRVMGSFFTLPSASKIHFFAHFLKPPTDAHTKTKQKYYIPQAFISTRISNTRSTISLSFRFLRLPTFLSNQKDVYVHWKKKHQKQKQWNCLPICEQKNNINGKKEMRSNKLGFSGRKEKRGETCRRRKAKRGRRRRPW